MNQSNEQKFLHLRDADPKTLTLDELEEFTEYWLIRMVQEKAQLADCVLADQTDVGDEQSDLCYSAVRHEMLSRELKSRAS